MACSIHAMADGDTYATEYASSEAGLIAALAAAGTGGIVQCGPGDLTITTVIAVPEKAKLILGVGTYTISGSGAFTLANKATISGKDTHSTVIAASADTSVTAVIQPAATDGTQQSVYIEGLLINGGKGLGATVTYGIYLKGVYVGTYIRDTTVIACSGNGICIDGGESSPGTGQLVLWNVTVTTCNDDNILILSGCDGIFGYQVSSESVAAGKAQLHIKHTGTGSLSNFGHYFLGVHMEGTTACDGIWLEKCANCLFDGVTYDGTNASNVVKITGTGSGSDGAYAASGHTFRNVFGNYATIIDDQTAGVTVGNTQSRWVAFYSSPSAAAGAINHQTIGIQAQMQGQDVASTAAMTLGNGNFFTITGTADITSITTAARDKGRIVTLLFSGTAAATGLTDGSNLKLSADLGYTPDDTITLISNGTNWYEMGRSVN